MVYVGMINAFGIFGFIAYLIAVISPIFFCAVNRTLTKIRICLILGLTNYLFVSLSDGAMLFIPTMAFFWFLTSLLARKNLDDGFRLTP
jgi:hypothetical protein